MKHWNRDEIEIIKKEASLGKSYKEIGLIIGRTGKAIALKMKKLGFIFEDFYKKAKLYCLNCGKELRRGQYKYCCSRCAAIQNNSKRSSKSQDMPCACCKQIIRGKSNSKYCSKDCELKDKKNERKRKMMAGDPSISSKSYRKFLIQEFGAKCMGCGWDKINPTTGVCPIELEHIDGNSGNNSISNLKLLCPNCHSLTSTYKALNRGNGRYKRMIRYRENKSY